MVSEENTLALSQMSSEKLLEKLLQYKDLYERECEEFEEYKQSSQEMELIMENDIERLNKEVSELKMDKQRLEIEGERTQTRYDHEKREQLKIEETLRKENESLRSDRDTLRTRLRELEQKNDDFERGDRYNLQLLEDNKKELNEAIERIAILESEMAEKQLSTEEVYRLREELKYSRPRMAVEPLRIEKRESVTEKESVAMDEEECTKSVEKQTVTENTTPPPADMSLSPPLPQAPPTSGFPFCVNRIVKDLLTKVDRLEGILTAIKNPRN